MSKLEKLGQERAALVARLEGLLPAHEAFLRQYDASVERLQTLSTSVYQRVFAAAMRPGLFPTTPVPQPVHPTVAPEIAAELGRVYQVLLKARLNPNDDDARDLELFTLTPVLHGLNAKAATLAAVPTDQHVAPEVVAALSELRVAHSLLGAAAKTLVASRDRVRECRRELAQVDETIRIEREERARRELAAVRLLEKLKGEKAKYALGGDDRIQPQVQFAIEQLRDNIHTLGRQIREAESQTSAPGWFGEQAKVAVQRLKRIESGCSAALASLTTFSTRLASKFDEMAQARVAFALLDRAPSNWSDEELGRVEALSTRLRELQGLRGEYEALAAEARAAIAKANVSYDRGGALAMREHDGRARSLEEARALERLAKRKEDGTPLERGEGRRQRWAGWLQEWNVRLVANRKIVASAQAHRTVHASLATTVPNRLERERRASAAARLQLLIERIEEACKAGEMLATEIATHIQDFERHQESHVEEARKSSRRIAELFDRLRGSDAFTQGETWDAEVKRLEKVEALPAEALERHDALERPSLDPLRMLGEVRLASVARRHELAEHIAKARDLERRESRLQAQMERIEEAAVAARPLASRSSAQVQQALARLDAGIALARSDARHARRNGQRQVGLALGQLASASQSFGHRSANGIRTLQTQIEERRDTIARIAAGLDPDGPATDEQRAMLAEVGVEVPGLRRLLGSDRGGRGGRAKSVRSARMTALDRAYEARDRKAGLAAIDPSGAKAAWAVQQQLDDMVDDLRRRGFPVRRKGWFDSPFQKLKALGNSAASGLSQIKQSAASGLSTLQQGAQSGLAFVTNTASSGIAAVKQGAQGGLALVQGAASKGIAALQQGGQSALSLAKAAGTGALQKVQQAKAGALAIAQQARQGGLTLLEKGKDGALSALGAARSGAAWVKGKAAATAELLGKGASWAKNRLGEAASTAWDLTKHGMRAVGNAAVGAWHAAKDGAGAAWGFYKQSWLTSIDVARRGGAWLGSKAKHLYQATGEALSSGWSNVTGVVGAGLRSAKGWAGQKFTGLKQGVSDLAKSIKPSSLLKGALLLNPVTAPFMLASKVVGNTALGSWAKSKWESAKGLGRSLWDGAKSVGKTVGGFLQSPAGQLLTTGLSLAATFIPGGLVVKAGVGALMGVIEAVSKGGGLKEALIGGALGAVEGALPFVKAGMVTKLALGAARGGLSSAVSGGSWGDIAKGALGGAWGAGGFQVLKKVGGGRGLKMLSGFMGGQGGHTGALGKLQKFTQSSAVQKAWGFATKHADKVKRAGVWVYDKSGKITKLADAIHTGGEYAQHALQGLSGLSAWGASKLDEGSWGKGALEKLSGWSAAGAEKLEGGLEYVKTAKEWAEWAHKWSGVGLKLSGVNPKKAVKELQKREQTAALKRELARRADERGDRQRGFWGKVGSGLGWVGEKTGFVEGMSDEQRKMYPKKQSFSEMMKELEDADRRLGKRNGEQNALAAWMGKAGAKSKDAALWLRGNLTVATGIIDKGTALGEGIQGALRNIALATEGVEDKGALKWIHETAYSWQAGLDEKLKIAKQVQGAAHVTTGALGGALRLGGVKKDDLEANDSRWKVWAGLEEAPDGSKRVWGGPNDDPNRKYKGDFIGPHEQHKTSSAWWAVAGQRAGDQMDAWKDRFLDSKFADVLLGQDEKRTYEGKYGGRYEEKKSDRDRALERLAEWQRVAQKRRDWMAERAGDLDENSRSRAFMRLLGAGDAKGYGKDPYHQPEEGEDQKDLSYSQDDDWSRYETRRQQRADGLPVGPPQPADDGAVQAQIARQVEPQVQKVAEKEANEVADAEADSKSKAVLASGKAAKKDGALEDRIGALLEKVSQLEIARIDHLAAERDEEARTGELALPKVYAAELASAMALLHELDVVMKLYGVDLSATREKLVDLAAFFNARQPVESKKPEGARRTREQVEDLELTLPEVGPKPPRTEFGDDVMDVDLTGGAAGRQGPRTEYGDDVMDLDELGLGEQPASALGAMASADGVVGAPKSVPTNGLAVIEYGDGIIDDPFQVPEPAFFGDLKGRLLAAEMRFATDLPQARALGEAGDLAKGEALYAGLRRELQALEVEFDRLRNAGFTDPSVADALARYGARILALRAQLEPPDAADEETPALDAVEGEAAEKQGDPLMALLGDAVEAAGDWLDRKLGTAPKKKPEPAEETYLGEAVDDTYIGSGASTRPVGEGLATNFRFDDEPWNQATVAGELAGLGGAVLGLGESIGGAVGDVGAFSDGLSGLGQSAGKFFGDAGELLGSRKNFATEGAAKLGDFAKWLKAGAGKVSGYGELVATTGADIHGFGTTWNEKGLGKAIRGQVFRKGRAGTSDPVSAPVADARTGEDEPRRLDGEVLSQMERFLGGRFGDVKIHTGAGAEYITRRFQAEAVTIRDHIFFAPGRFQPGSTEGRKLIAHELTHVAQRGRMNLDVRTAEEEAHRAEAAFGTPGMEVLDLSEPQPDFHLDMGGAEQETGPVRTAKKTRSVTSGSAGIDEQVEGEELLDLVGERVYELMLKDLEEEFENR